MTPTALFARAAAMPGVGYLLVTLSVVFAVLDPHFVSMPNLLNIGTQTSTLLLLALPMTLIIMSEGLDLSMGAVLGLAGVVLAMQLASGSTVVTALACAVAVGATFGIANGLLIVTIGIPPFVTTLGMLYIAQGVALAVTDGRSIVGIGNALPALYASRWLGVPFSIAVAGMTYAAFHFVLYHTRFGVYVFAIGGNRESLILAGVRARLYHVGVYAIGGVMAGLAALLFTARTNAGHPTAAMGMEFDAIAAVIVGGTSFERGNGWLPGTLLGVLTVGVLKNGLNVMEVQNALQVASIGLLVIVALLIDSVRGAWVSMPLTPASTRGTASAGLIALGYRLAGVMLVCTTIAFLSSAFLTAPNLLNVLRQASLTFLIASGVTLVILTAGLDLSIGANVGLSACVAASAFKSTGAITAGVGAGLVCGTTVGALNGLMVTLLGLPPFIATYGMLWMVHGFTYWYMAGQTIYGFPPAFRALGSGYLLGIPVPVYLMAASLGAGGLFTRYTTYGYEIYAIGANAEAARLSGIPVRARLNLVYTLSGAMAGLAAVVYLARLNSAEADIGEPLMLPAIAAVLIGGTSLFGGIGSLSGTLIGAVTLTVVLNGMNLLNISANWQPTVTGVIVIMAVWIDIVTRRRADAKN